MSNIDDKEYEVIDFSEVSEEEKDAQIHRGSSVEENADENCE